MNMGNIMEIMGKWLLLVMILFFSTHTGLSNTIQTNGEMGPESSGDVAEPAVHIQLDKEAGKAQVYIRGEHFTTYNFHENNRIPYLWPVYADGGITITRNWPMGEDDPEITDHPHHQSLWTAFGDVNGSDHWHNEPIITESVEVQSEDDYGLIRAQGYWADEHGTPIVDEIREYRFYDSPASGRIFDHTITFIASNGDVTFGDDKEGMFAFRIRTEIQGNRAGVLTNSEGKQGESEVYGTPGPWMDYSGPIEGVGVRGIALFSHPGNIRLPAWHVRNYGLVGCNFFAMQDVAGLDEAGTYVLSEGDEITFHARFYIHNGDAEQAGVSEQYEEFARTPFPER